MTGGLYVVTVGAAVVAGVDADGSSVVAALARAGLPVAARAFVDEDDAALGQVLARDGGVTVIVAGAGGSAGDVVRRVLARVAGVRLVLNDRMLSAIEQSYQRRNRAMPRRAERLGLLPQGAVLWPTGGEPAWVLETDRAAFVVLPRGAVPSLDPLIEEHVVPLARARLARSPVGRTLKMVGVTVAEVEDRLIDVLGRDGDVSAVVVPLEGEVWVRLRTRGAVMGDAADALDALEAEIVALAGEDCYGRDGDELEHVVGRALTARGLTLAVAESCTGGLIAHRLTNVSGSSAYLERGVVVYSNRAKMELLGVPESVLRAHGAVSAPTAEAMVRGVCAAAGTPCGLSVTGIAGPQGGTPTKPVGTVFIGVAVPGEVVTKRFAFAGDRASIKWQSSLMALDMLRRLLGAAGPRGE
jgi:nicotinamide-nucleotide amidase